MTQRMDTGRLSSTKRVDLHCHSKASTEADEALLLAIKCPESYSEPRQVYDQARSRGMDFVTITDHDSLAGVRQLTELPGVLTGEEVTCYFPEDRCKIHLLVWGLTDADHTALQAVANDIYDVSNVVWQRDLAHAVAHPLYRQNDVLERWHIERLLLLFRGFECLNGAHSTLHREAFEPVLDRLCEDEIRRLERMHGLTARGNKPWQKVRTGGSDDHGLFNIGRTWTEFPADADSPEKVIEYLKNGQCRPGGEAGSSVKLAHNFYGVGIRYYTREMAGQTPSGQSAFLKRLVGDETTRPGMGSLLTAGAKVALASAKSRMAGALGLRQEARGTGLLESLMTSALLRRFGPLGGARHEHAYHTLLDALKSGRAPLAEHEAVFSLVSDLMREVSNGVAADATDAVHRGELGRLFDLVSTVLAQQALLTPYYFALFHQNQERHLFSRLTGIRRRFDASTVRVGLFTDDYGVGCEEQEAFARAASDLAAHRNWDLATLRCRTAAETCPAKRGRAQDITFASLATTGLGVGGITLHLPPVLDLLELADRKQFDVVVINSAGPMALAGVLVAKMLRVPVVSMLHTDAVSTMLDITDGDYRMSSGAKSYNRWLHGLADRVIVASEAGQCVARELGVESSRIELHRTATRSAPPRRAPRQGRVVTIHAPMPLASRRDAGLLATVIERLAFKGDSVRMVVSGNGRHTEALRQRLANLPVHFCTEEPDISLIDLLVDVSGADLTGRRVMQAHGAQRAVVVRAGSAGAEILASSGGGLTVSGDSPELWVDAVHRLISDAELRANLEQAGHDYARELPESADIDRLWTLCVQVASKHAATCDAAVTPPSKPSTTTQETFTNVTEGVVGV